MFLLPDALMSVCLACLFCFVLFCSFVNCYTSCSFKPTSPTSTSTSISINMNVSFFGGSVLTSFPFRMHCRVDELLIACVEPPLRGQHYSVSCRLPDPLCCTQRYPAGHTTAHFFPVGVVNPASCASAKCGSCALAECLCVILLLSF